MNLPHLSRHQAHVLVLWSAAMILGKSCETTTAACWLDHVVGGTYYAWRQRLRDWCYDACDKKGEKREEISVDTYFAPLLRWLLTWWADSPFLFSSSRSLPSVPDPSPSKIQVSLFRFA